MVRIIDESVVVTIPHPVYPELKVRARVKTAVEEMDMMSDFVKYKRIVTVQDKDGNVVRNDDGDLETVTLTALPSEAVIDLMDDVLEGWEGLEDNKGVPIPFKRENIKHLFARSLFVPTKNKKGKDINQAFPDYIQAELNKYSENLLKAEDTESPKSKSSPKQR